MTTHPDSPKDQSPSTLAEEFERDARTSTTVPAETLMRLRRPLAVG